MTRRHITPRGNQASGRSVPATVPAGPTPGTSLAAGPVSAARVRLRQGGARCGSWPGQPRTASTARCTGVRQPPRTAGARAATRPPSAHGPIQLLCWQATRLPPGRVTRARRARRARR